MHIRHLTVDLSSLKGDVIRGSVCFQSENVQEARRYIENLFKQLLWAENISSKPNCLKSQLKDFWVVWVMLKTLLDVISSQLAPMSTVELRLNLVEVFRQSVGRTWPGTELCVVVIVVAVATSTEQRRWLLRKNWARQIWAVHLSRASQTAWRLSGV